jgi:hypothetical protein
MTDPISKFNDEVFALKVAATQEAYDYFEENIHPFERDEKGQIKVHNNDVDAFRHAYVSGVMTQKYGSFRANILGQLNELKGDIVRDQPKEEKNMDLWNNAVGRKYGEQTKSRKKLAELIKEALNKGALIITTNQSEDSRKYSEVEQYIDREKPVVVLKESKTGRNEVFLDLIRSSVMSREGFVAKISRGVYPGYTVASIDGLKTPMSNPDGVASNNLG